jgi:hypothetical protein
MKKYKKGRPTGTGISRQYANYFKVGHNGFEFFFDFGQSLAESKDVLIHTRIVAAPGYAKAFMETLRESIAKHEETYGIIDMG